MLHGRLVSPLLASLLLSVRSHLHSGKISARPCDKENQPLSPSDSVGPPQLFPTIQWGVPHYRPASILRTVKSKLDGPKIRQTHKHTQNSSLNIPFAGETRHFYVSWLCYLLRSRWILLLCVKWDSPACPFLRLFLYFFALQRLFSHTNSVWRHWETLQKSFLFPFFFILNDLVGMQLVICSNFKIIKTFYIIICLIPFLYILHSLLLLTDLISEKALTYLGVAPSNPPMLPVPLANPNLHLSALSKVRMCPRSDYNRVRNYISKILWKQKQSPASLEYLGQCSILRDLSETCHIFNTSCSTFRSVLRFRRGGGGGWGGSKSRFEPC